MRRFTTANPPRHALPGFGPILKSNKAKVAAACVGIGLAIAVSALLLLVRGGQNAAPPLDNADFSSWSAAAPADHGQIPSGWDSYSNSQLPDVTRTLPLGTSGVVFEVQRGQDNAQAPEWAEAALVQKVSVSRCPIVTLALGSAPEYRTASDGRSPILAPGVQVFDDVHPGKVVWMMLSKAAYRDTLPNRSTAIWQMPVTADGRASFDLAPALAWLGDSRAQSANLKLAVAVHKQVPGLQRMEVKSISCSARN